MRSEKEIKDMLINFQKAKSKCRKKGKLGASIYASTLIALLQWVLKTPKKKQAKVKL